MIGDSVGNAGEVRENALTIDAIFIGATRRILGRGSSYVLILNEMLPLPRSGDSSFHRIAGCGRVLLVRYVRLSYDFTFL